MKRQPVCPRCLGETPGIPAGDPDHPHPGPFTREVCTECRADALEARARELELEAHTLYQRAVGVRQGVCGSSDPFTAPK